MNFVDLYKGAMLVAVKMFCVMITLLWLFPLLPAEATLLLSILTVVLYTKLMEHVL